jgi:hypothetical protein
VVLSQNNRFLVHMRVSNRESVNYEEMLFHKLSQRRGIENTRG